MLPTTNFFPQIKSHRYLYSFSDILFGTRRKVTSEIVAKFFFVRKKARTVLIIFKSLIMNFISHSMIINDFVTMKIE